MRLAFDLSVTRALSSTTDRIKVDSQVATKMTRILAWLGPRAWTTCFTVLLSAAILRAEELPQDYRVHREGLLRELSHLVSEGHREDASELARRAMSSTSSLPRSDARRGNAIELSLQVSLPDLGRDRALAQRALAMASELLAIRRNQRPPDLQLLSVALLTQGSLVCSRQEC